MTTGVALSHVTCHGTDGARSVLVLDDVSLRVEAGEFVAVWGRRRSGRSTLLRIAAGIQRPTTGSVLLDGDDIAIAVPGRSVLCHTVFRISDGPTVLDQVTVPLLARGVRRSDANRAGRSLLERCDVADLADSDPRALDPAGAIAVALARGLAAAPSVLLIDEPAMLLDTFERDRLLALLRSLAERERIAIVATEGETTATVGAHRVLWLTGARLRGSAEGPAPATVPVRRVVGQG